MSSTCLISSPLLCGPVKTAKRLLRVTKQCGQVVLFFQLLLITKETQKEESKKFSVVARRSHAQHCIF